MRLRVFTFRDPKFEGLPHVGSGKSGLARAALLSATFTAVAVLAVIKLPAESDLVVYAHYAHLVLHGSLSAGLPREYPALATGVFLAPLAMPLAYPVAFAVCMGAVFLTLYWSGRHFGEQWCVRFVTYSALSTLCIIFARYDLVPALMILLATRAAIRHRWASAWTWAALGTLFKLFPLLLLPGFLIAEYRETGRLPLRRVLALVGGSGVLALVQTIVASGTLLNPLRFEEHRGFEFSSVAGSLTFLTSPFHVLAAYRYSNLQLYGPGHSLIEGILLLAAGTGLGAIWYLAARLRLPVAVTTLAVLTVAVLTSKSFAPQYLIWLAPLWAMWDWRASWLVAALLTAIVWPVGVLLAPHVGGVSLPVLILLALVRNAVLVLGSARWFVEVVRTHNAHSVAARAEMDPRARSDKVCATPFTL